MSDHNRDTGYRKPYIDMLGSGSRAIGGIGLADRVPTIINIGQRTTANGMDTDVVLNGAVLNGPYCGNDTTINNSGNIGCTYSGTLAVH